MADLGDLTDEETAAFAASALMTLAQAGVALDQAYERRGYATKHFGQLLLGVTAQGADLFGGDERASWIQDLIVDQMGLDRSSQQWRFYARMPVDSDRVESLGTPLFEASFLPPGEAEPVFDVLVGDFFGYEPGEDLPATIFLNSRHAVLGLVTVEQDTRDRSELERAARMNLAATFEAQLLVMWRMMEQAAVLSGRDLGYQIRP